MEITVVVITTIMVGYMLRLGWRINTLKRIINLDEQIISNKFQTRQEWTNYLELIKQRTKLISK
jgi:hypothetical protein